MGYGRSITGGGWLIALVGHLLLWLFIYCCDACFRLQANFF